MKKMKRIVLPVIAVIAAVTLASVAGWLALDNKAHAQSNLPAPANVQMDNQKIQANSPRTTYCFTPM